LFGKAKFEDLAEHLADDELEGLSEDNTHRFLPVLCERCESRALSADVLLGYDQNVVRHTLRLNENRHERICWKYFQWLSLLFTEVYLDRLFRGPVHLLADLNACVTAFNEGKATPDQVPGYEADDLRKLAFWSATGSGKTLLMHVNVLQYRYYLA